MARDKKELQGALMEQHRRIINEIADIKAANFELSEEDKSKVTKLESKLKIIAEKLYLLYNE
jgi:hypothetical protein